MKALLLMVLAAFVTCQPVKAADQSISQSTYETLNEIQVFLQEEKWPEAEEELSRLSEKLKPSFGLALTYQLYGQFYLAQEKNTLALEQFEKALKLEKLAPSQESALATNVAQLYLGEEKKSEAVTSLRSRLLKIEKAEAEANKKTPEKPKVYIQPMAYATLAMAYHLQQKYSEVIPWINKALDRSKQPKENWLQVMTVAYYQQKEYLKAAQGFQRLLNVNPQKEDYWIQQASMYQLLEQPKNSMKTMETAYAGGYLTKDNNLMLLVQLLISNGLPERGGRILSQQLNAGKIELNERNWRLLASAWQQGRERSNAITALREAAKFTDNGKLLVRAAQMSIQNNDYHNVIVDIEAAIKKGLTDKQKGNALILAGNSAFELQDYPTAKRYFQRALKEPDSASSARTWLDYIASVEEYL
jgi:tetratricopeptide (TPR) repeat protein